MKQSMTIEQPLPDENPSTAEGVPPEIVESLRRYARHHTPVGSFLTSVLSNDLMQATGRADDRNGACLVAICRFVYCALPGSCHGNPEKVRAWLARGEDANYV